jgi:hypothetical protein
MSWVYHISQSKIYIIQVKFSDGSLLDCLEFDYLKQKLFLIKSRFLQGVWKSPQEVWSDMYYKLIFNP